MKIKGPEGTPYQGGLFELILETPRDFPLAPFKARFVTKIFHPNVGPEGEVCVDKLKSGWSPSDWALSEIFDVTTHP